MKKIGIAVFLIASMCFTSGTYEETEIRTQWRKNDINNVIDVKPLKEILLGDNLILDGIVGKSAGGSNDPGLKNQYFLHKTGSENLWKEVEQEETVRVAVIDTGVDYTHVELKNRVNVELGYDFANNDSDPMDDNGHGTHVSGIIAAETNNNEGISGVVGELDVEIMPIKVLDKKGKGNASDIAKGIRFAVDNGADIINLSLGGTTKDKSIEEAIEYALDKGVFVVAASGNDGENADGYVPAGVSGVYTVAASTMIGRVASFSNYGKCIDITAPGERIISTIPGDRYGAYDGTSMAAPLVSGIAAILIAEDYDISNNELKSILNQTAGDVVNEKGELRCGSGMINGKEALQVLKAKEEEMDYNHNSIGVIDWSKVIQKNNLIGYIKHSRKK